MEHLLLYENKTDFLEAQENFIMSIYIEKAFINIIIIKVHFYQFKRIETTEKRIGKFVMQCVLLAVDKVFWETLLFITFYRRGRGGDKIKKCCRCVTFH